MIVENRNFSCDKCGAIHKKQTNHKGQIYMQKCDNWGCTSGAGQYTSMTCWEGDIIERKCNFYRTPDYENKVKMMFKI